MNTRYKKKKKTGQKDGAQTLMIDYKLRAQRLMMDHWHSLPLPDYYPYPLRLSPHLFMGLGKFVAGHIHHMRSQKSYLAAHPS